VTAGIVFGVVLSLLLLIARLAPPHTAVLGRHPTRGFNDREVDPEAEPVAGVVAFRVDGPLVFASVDGALDDLRAAIEGAGQPPRVVVLDLSSTHEIDVTAADALATLAEDLGLDGIELRFAHAHAQVRDNAARLGLPQLAGLAEPYPTVAAAVDDLERR
jgi:sulfate permease, SulP family